MDLVRADAAGAAQRLGGRGHVAAFLDCNEPDIPSGVRAAAALLQEDGRVADSGLPPSIVVVPYFLHAGKHVARDLIELLEGGRSTCGRPPMRLAPHLGCLDSMGQIAFQRIKQALPAAFGRISTQMSGDVWHI
jgi:sirohydrochlorin ferrochelatase